MDIISGEMAALGTALAFSFTSSFFAFAGREVGSPIVNRTRLLVAVILIFLVHRLTFGEFVPVGVSSSTVMWLVISGVIGLALGDASLFQAFIMVGPRISMLIVSLAPVIGAVIAWIFLGEILSVREIIGMALTIGGIVWVVAERTPQTNVPVKEPVQADGRILNTYMIGLLFALGGATGQAVGLVTAKVGLSDNFPPLSALLIRLIAAGVVLWILTVYRGKTRITFQTLKRKPHALRFILMGTLVGPLLGVWLSLVAVQSTSVGIASTLMGLTPIFLLPIGVILFHERVTARAVLGTFLAFGGTVLLLT